LEAHYSKIRAISEFELKRVAVISFAVEPELLKPFLPANTELDYWNDKCLLCLQGYTVNEIELNGHQIPFHKSVDVMNLHFYVKHQIGDQIEYGIVYIKNIVSKSFIAVFTNHYYKSNAKSTITACVHQVEDEMIAATYSWIHKSKSFSFHVMGKERPVPYRPNSFEEFISTHQWVFAKSRNTQTLQYKIAHSKWQFHQILNVRVKLDFGTVFGEEFYYLNEEKPFSVALAEGSYAGITSRILI
jgi:uncharacterized protein YqjF (DUF2071 family)